jgi:hypothetical protein
MPFTASEYAQQPKTDAATAMCMRIAMANAVFAMLGEVQKNGLKSFTAEQAKAALRKASTEHPILQAAGTSELVARYFEQVIDRQKNPTQAVKNFLGPLEVSQQEVQAAAQGTLSDFKLLLLADDFLKSARKNLGVKTLTEDFRAVIKDSKITKNILINPTPFTPEENEFISTKYHNFVLLDKLDNAASKVGLGNPSINHLIDAPVEPISPFVEAAVRLRDGTSKNPEADYQIIAQNADVDFAVRDTLFVTLPKFDIKGLIDKHGARPKTTQEYSAFGDAALEVLMRARTSDSSFEGNIHNLFTDSCKYEVAHVPNTESLGYSCPSVASGEARTK